MIYQLHVSNNFGRELADGESAYWPRRASQKAVESHALACGWCLL